MLIIGGGDGASVREIVKHPEVEKIVMVEIDANVVEASKQFLPQMSSAFNNPKLELIIGDGIQYVAQAPDKSFDYVIVDGSDPVGRRKACSRKNSTGTASGYSPTAAS